jgi:positive regulator of sigma E activity
MNKFHRFSEKMYLFFGFVFTFEALVNVQTMNERFYISCILGVSAFGMFLFRRKYRKKFESRNQNQ